MGNPVDVGLTRGTISSSDPLLISHHGSKKGILMAVSPLWRGLGILGCTQDDGPYRLGRLLLANLNHAVFLV